MVYKEEMRKKEKRHMSTSKDLKLVLDSIIGEIERIKNEITEENFEHFSITYNSNRDLQPNYEIGKFIATGFKQVSPLCYDLKIIDRRKENTVLD